MGLTFVEARIANPARPSRSAAVKFLVDSGAVYSIVPAAVLARLLIRPHSTRVFTLADGSEIRRRLGDAIFVIDGNRGASPVIFGEQEDSVLLGSVSLESLGLMLDPFKRVLRPLPMVLGRAKARRFPVGPRRIMPAATYSPIHVSHTVALFTARGLRPLAGGSRRWSCMGNLRT